MISHVVWNSSILYDTSYATYDRAILYCTRCDLYVDRMRPNRIVCIGLNTHESHVYEYNYVHVADLKILCQASFVSSQPLPVGLEFN